MAPLTPQPVQAPAIVAVIGAGYVGLTTAACLAHLGHQVTAVDVDPGKIERLAAAASRRFWKKACRT